jgi:uncharacterized protein YjbI with pentapeptide repeats
MPICPPRTAPESDVFSPAFHRRGWFAWSGAVLLISLVAASTGISQGAAADCGSMPTQGIDWQQCDKSSLLLRSMDFQGANLLEADFTSTDLRDTNLEGANLEKAKLIRSSLAGAKADKANFSRIEAYRTDFAGISAKGSSFASAELQRANFTGAELSGADFQKAELGRANFKDAQLTGVRFSFANLSRADLHEARFEGALDFGDAFLFLARLEGLDLSASTGLTQAQIDLACGDGDTKLPAGLNAAASWPCKFD